MSRRCVSDISPPRLYQRIFASRMSSRVATRSELISGEIAIDSARRVASLSNGVRHGNTSTLRYVICDAVNEIETGAGSERTASLINIDDEIVREIVKERLELRRGETGYDVEIVCSAELPLNAARKGAGDKIADFVSLQRGDYGSHCA